KARVADHAPHDGRQSAAREHAEPGRQARVDGEERGGVGADADEPRVADRVLAGEAADQVPGGAQVGEEHHPDEHLDPVLAVAEEAPRQQRHDEREEDGGAAEPAPDPAPPVAHRRATPSRPDGRARRIATKTAPSPIRAAACTQSATMPSIRPTRSPPTAAPGTPWSQLASTTRLPPPGSLCWMIAMATAFVAGRQPRAAGSTLSCLFLVHLLERRHDG